MQIGKTGLITLLSMFLIIGAVLVYIIFFVDESEVQKRDKTPAAQALLQDEGEQAFTNMNDEPISVADHFGKIMVVSSWASWCPECQYTLGELSKIADEYKDRGVVVLAINRAEDRYSAERFLQTVTVSPNLKIILDPADTYFEGSAGYAMPETIVYTKDGTEALHQRGAVQVEELKHTLEEITK